MVNTQNTYSLANNSVKHFTNKSTLCQL